MNDLMISVFVQDDGNFLITAENGKITLQTVSNEKLIIAKVIWLQFKVWVRSLIKK